MPRRAALIAGRWLRRPSATRIAMGNARKIDKVASMTVSGRPPHRSVRTGVSPKMPPPISAKKVATPDPHRREPGTPESADAARHERAQHQRRGHLGPPLLVERVATEEDESILLRHDTPACADAARCLAGVRHRVRRRRRTSTTAPRRAADTAPLPISATVASALCQSPNRLWRSHGSHPRAGTGAGRGAMGRNVSTTVSAP